MASKMRFPNPYPWYRAKGDKNYIMVTSTKENEVIKLVEAPSLNEDNMEELAKKIADKWFELSTKYRPPEYDIISMKAGSIEEIAQVLGVDDGFVGVEKEIIS